MPEKYRIVTTDSRTDRRQYYVARDALAGEIKWTEEPICATTFASKGGAENVLRQLEDQCRAMHIYSILMEIERVGTGKPSAEGTPAPKKESPPPRSEFTFVKAPPIRFFIEKTERGEFRYSFADENGNVRAEGTGYVEAGAVIDAYCGYVRSLMRCKIAEAEERRARIYNKEGNDREKGKGTRT